MYITDEMLSEVEAEYGRPYERSFQIETTAREIARIRASQKAGRNHDVTLYVRDGDRLIVMAKHMYPPGLYRAPSGGIHPGETFHEGVEREVAEELGCEIDLERYFLRTGVVFTHESDVVFWRSFVFLARYVGGEFNFTDHDEIREVDSVTWSDFERFGEMMRETEIGGLHYRAELHEVMVELLTAEGNPPPGV